MFNATVCLTCWASLILRLIHWGRVTHICISKLTTIGSDNGLSPGRRQAIIWTNAGILLIGPLGTNFSKILIKIHTFSFKKMWLKVSTAKWRPSCLGLNVLRYLSEIHEWSHINFVYLHNKNVFYIKNLVLQLKLRPFPPPACIILLMKLWQL